MEFRHPLLDKRIEPERLRVFMLAGSDVDMVSPAFSDVPHRVIISDDAMLEPWHYEQFAGWEVRRIPVEPPYRLLVVDHKATVTVLDDAYLVKGFQFAEDDEVEQVVAYFEGVWNASRPHIVTPPSAQFRRDRITITDAHWRTTIRELASKPAGLRDLQPQELEQLVAQLLTCEGFEVQTTKTTRDGGRDILAWSDASSGRALWLIECKRYARSRKIDVAIVRSFYGVLEAERASFGMLVTTSDFTPPARQYQYDLPNRLLLRNYGELAKWVRRIAERAT